MQSFEMYYIWRQSRKASAGDTGQHVAIKLFFWHLLPSELQAQGLSFAWVGSLEEVHNQLRCQLEGHHRSSDFLCQWNFLPPGIASSLLDELGWVEGASWQICWSWPVNICPPFSVFSKAVHRSPRQPDDQATVSTVGLYAMLQPQISVAPAWYKRLCLPQFAPGQLSSYMIEYTGI